jgi:hypothetical protein
MRMSICGQSMSASLIGHSGSSAFRLSTATVSTSLAGSCFSSESAPGALPSWDSKIRWNNLSVGLTVRVTTGSKLTCDLTSSIVPRGTSFHRSVELDCPPIGFGFARFSCCCRGLFPGPAELGAVNPDAVHDHGQPTRQGHDRRLAICIAQALSHDHFFERNML